MTRFSINGLTYHVEERGASDPVVMLHGFSGSTETWRPLMAAASRYFRAIAVDLPGHGQTDAPRDAKRYRMERVAEDLIVLLKQLEALPAHWLGYSMGGRLALYIACRHPESVRSLALESASPGLLSASERKARIAQDTALAEQIEQEGVERFIDYWQNIPLFSTQKRLPEASRAALRAQRLNNSTGGLANSLRGMGTGAQPELWSELENLPMSVMLIAGEEDAKFVALNRRMAAAIPRASLEIVTGAGHAVHLEAAHIYNNLVMGFFTRSSEGDGHYLSNAKEGNEYQRRQ